MSTWSSRRRFKYGLLVIFVLVIFIGVPAFFIFYEAPTCFDGKKNSSELDVDCGGKCSRLCQSAFLLPKIAWGGAKFERIAPGRYNVASYIINPNLNGAAINVPYKISLYDNEGILITEKKGSMTISAHRNALAFEPAVDVGSRIPVKATFEFTEAPEWFKSHDTLGDLIVIDKRYVLEDIGSALEVEFENKGLLPYKNLDIFTVLYDLDGNVVNFSKTKIDSISPRGGREIAVFTWPYYPENDDVVSIEVIPAIEPVVDK